MPIRSATPADFPAIEALLQRAYEPVLAMMSPANAADLRNTIPKMVSRYGAQGTWFVSGNGGRLLGCVAFFPPHSVAHRIFDESWAHIQLLGVDASHLRHGLGRELMRHCLSAARAAGVTTLALQTSELMVPARRLYESLGFVLERSLDPAFGHPTYLYLHREI